MHLMIAGARCSGMHLDSALWKMYSTLRVVKPGQGQQAATHRNEHSLIRRGTLWGCKDAVVLA